MRVTSRKAAHEALIGAHAGRVLSRVILKNQSADAVPKGGRPHQQVRNCEHLRDSARSKTPACMETSKPGIRRGRAHSSYMHANHAMDFLVRQKGEQAALEVPARGA